MIDLNQYGDHKGPSTTLADCIGKFQAVLAAEGYGSPEIEADGVLHRFPLPDDKGHDKTGWYVFYADGVPAGCFGNWKEGSSIPWCSKKTYEMTDAECAEHDQRMKRAKDERDAKQAEAQAEAANKYWDSYQQLPQAPDDHPYLVKKKVTPMDGVRIARSGRLAVPLRDAENSFWGVQWIDGEGKKKFGSGVKTKGNFFLIDGDRSTMFVCEGYATGASIAMATGQAVVVAFNAGNLDAATASAKQAFPGSKFVIAADDDRWTKTPKGAPCNPGQVKASEAAAKHCLPMVTPTFKDLSKHPTDFNDLHALEGIDTVRAQLARAGQVSPRDKLKALTVKKEYVNMLGKESWLFRNLVIKGQILTIIAKSGGGKTAIFFDFVTPWIIAHHDNMTVFYFDCDSPASDHDTMLCKAEAMGPRCQWINPLTHGKGPEVLVDALKEFVACGERLDDAFFVLDTLKKFIDMLDKKSVKPFFSLLRQLTALGATIALLGHANKHRDNDGNLVFEGVNDVMSDTDALIVFERVKSADGGIDVTTICDPDKGAKVRGLYKPMSFHIAPDRTVTLCKDVVAVPDYSKDAAKRGRLTEEEIQDRIRAYLQEQDDVVPQSQILDDLKGEPGISYHDLRKTLIACAGAEYAGIEPGQIFYRSGFTNNKKLYGVSR